MQGDAVNTAATGGDRIDIDLHDVAARVEAGQQLVAVAISGLVAKLAGEPDREEGGLATL